MRWNPCGWEKKKRSGRNNGKLFIGTDVESFTHRQNVPGKTDGGEWVLGRLRHNRGEQGEAKTKVEDNYGGVTEWMRESRIKRRSSCLQWKSSFGGTAVRSRDEPHFVCRPNTWSGRRWLTR